MENNNKRQVRLLVDIKRDYKESLGLLLREVQPLLPYLTTSGRSNRIVLIVTGNRPLPAEYDRYPSYVFFDDDLKQSHTPGQWKRVGLVSLPFNKISSWKGTGEIDPADKQAVKQKIDSVHAAGKPIRFWAAPDTPDSWKLQKQLHADLIGTDRIADLATWMHSGQK